MTTSSLVVGMAESEWTKPMSPRLIKEEHQLLLCASPEKSQCDSTCGGLLVLKLTRFYWLICVATAPLLRWRSEVGCLYISNCKLQTEIGLLSTVNCQLSTVNWPGLLLDQAYLPATNPGNPATPLAPSSCTCAARPERGPQPHRWSTRARALETRVEFPELARASSFFLEHNTRGSEQHENPPAAKSPPGCGLCPATARLHMRLACTEVGLSGPSLWGLGPNPAAHRCPSSGRTRRTCPYACREGEETPGSDPRLGPLAPALDERRRRRSGGATKRVHTWRRWRGSATTTRVVAARAAVRIRRLLEYRSRHLRRHVPRHHPAGSPAAVRRRRCAVEVRARSVGHHARCRAGSIHPVGGLAESVVVAARGRGWLHGRPADPRVGDFDSAELREVPNSYTSDRQTDGGLVPRVSDTS